MSTSKPKRSASPIETRIENSPNKRNNNTRTAVLDRVNIKGSRSKAVRTDVIEYEGSPSLKTNVPAFERIDALMDRVTTYDSLAARIRLSVSAKEIYDALNHDNGDDDDDDKVQIIKDVKASERKPLQSQLIILDSDDDGALDDEDNDTV